MKAKLLGLLVVTFLFVGCSTPTNVLKCSTIEKTDEYDYEEIRILYYDEDDFSVLNKLEQITKIEAEDTEDAHMMLFFYSNMLEDIDEDEVFVELEVDENLFTMKFTFDIEDARQNDMDVVSEEDFNYNLPKEDLKKQFESAGWSCEYKEN